MVRSKVLLLSVIIMSLILYAAAPPIIDGRESTQKLRVNSERLSKRIMELAEIGKNAQGGIDRMAFTEADIQGRSHIITVMREAGLKVRIDEAGNIIGRKEGIAPELSPIVFGSHIDTVPNGGKYDGAAGVLTAIECVHVLQEHGIFTRHPLEVVVFTNEEGGLVGSLAMIGELTEKDLNMASREGKSILEGIRALGGNPNSISRATRHPEDIKAFIELHIEQGGVLEAKKINIGIVEGIVGINRWDVNIEGFANHAGTTPMNMRQDALLAASHLILAVHRVVTSLPGRQVGTVGKIRVEPGAPNVIPGLVVMSLELRDLSAQKIQALFESIKQEAGAIEEKTGTKITFTRGEATAVPAPTDPGVRSCIALAAEELNLSTLLMPSGAGHDAQNMARIAPTGMIFIPSVNGVSHSPKEYSRPEDITNGANVLLLTILKIDQGCQGQ